MARGNHGQDDHDGKPPRRSINQSISRAEVRADVRASKKERDDIAGHEAFARQAKTHEMRSVGIAGAEYSRIIAERNRAERIKRARS